MKNNYQLAIVEELIKKILDLDAPSEIESCYQLLFRKSELETKAS